jgi:hypothetical protein
MPAATATLTNALFFQLTWFGTVLGASNDQSWWALPGLAALVAWSVRQRRLQADLPLAVAFGVSGWLLDTLWIELGLLAYGTPMAPVWILVLWVAVALTMNHSLAWFRRHPLNGAVLAALAAPLCYLSGEQLGAVSVPRPASLIWISATWGLLFYLAFRYLPQPDHAAASPVET